MAEAFRTLYQGQVPASATTLYTVPASTKTAVKHMKAKNTSGGNVTLTLWLNGVTDPYNTDTVVLGPGWSCEWDMTQGMNTTEYIAGMASAAASISLEIDGDEVT